SPCPRLYANVPPNCGARPRAPASLPIAPAARTRRPGLYSTLHTTSRALDTWPARRLLWGKPFPRSAPDHREYSCRHVTEQGLDRPGFEFCGELLRWRHTSANEPRLRFRLPPRGWKVGSSESRTHLFSSAWVVGFAALNPPTGQIQLAHHENPGDGIIRRCGLCEGSAQRHRRAVPNAHQKGITHSRRSRESRPRRSGIESHRSRSSGRTRGGKRGESQMRGDPQTDRGEALMRSAGGLRLSANRRIA